MDKLSEAADITYQNTEEETCSDPFEVISPCCRDQEKE
jgi:hypothetical protein